jgi:hypothetical protein
MADIVMAISGEKLVPVEVEDKDDYCEYCRRDDLGLRYRENAR